MGEVVYGVDAPGPEESAGGPPVAHVYREVEEWFVGGAYGRRVEVLGRVFEVLCQDLDDLDDGARVVQVWLVD